MKPIVFSALLAFLTSPIAKGETAFKPQIFFNIAQEQPARINLELTAVSYEEQDMACSLLVRANLGYESVPGVQTSILIPNVEILVKSMGQKSETVSFGKQELTDQGVPGLRFVDAQIETFTCHAMIRANEKFSITRSQRTFRKKPGTRNTLRTSRS